MMRPNGESLGIRTPVCHALAAAAVACVIGLPAGPAGAAASAAGSSPAPTLEDLAAATYSGLEGDSSVTLVNGVWEGPPFVEGSNIRPRVTWVRRYRLTGDLDRDGDDEAVVFLAQGLGGSGELLFAAVVDRVEGGVKNVATTLLGDQVQVRAASVANGRLVLDVIQVGEPDARCCPGDWLTRTFTLGPKGLTEVPSKAPMKRLSPAALGGGTWVLRSWNWEEPLADSVEVTLVLEGSILSGDAGCNRYSVPHKSGDLPGDIRLGPIQATKRACPEPAMSVEARYLDLLERTRKFAFVATELMVTWEKDQAYGTMIFERKRGR
jgi:heat shock protein HslJ